MLPLFVVSHRPWSFVLRLSRSLTWLATARTCVSGTSAIIVDLEEKRAAFAAFTHLSQNYDGRGEIRDNAAG